MNNRFLLVVFGIFLTSIVFGQVEGHVLYLAKHDWVKKFESVDYISKQQREKMAYIWGNNPEWNEYTELTFSPKMSVYVESDKKATNQEEWNWKEKKDQFEIIHDYTAGTFREARVVLNKNTIIEDTLIKPIWKIKNDIKEVAGHICMNASMTDSLRLLSFEAWFALDMPVSTGPEGFWGLPGLILELNVNNGGLILTAETITLGDMTEQLSKTKKAKGKKIDYASYRETIAKHFKIKREAEESPYWGMRYL